MENHYREILKNAKIKATSQRLFILDILGNVHAPLSVVMICQKLKGKDIDQVTVYRTLQLFLKMGLIKRVDLRKDVVYYEIASHHHHHHHIVCTRCGIIEDFESCKIEETAKSILHKSKKFQFINDHSFELFGLCKPCSKKLL